MGNELFLESEIFPPPRTQKEHWPPDHMEYDEKEFLGTWVNAYCHLQTPPASSIPIATTLLQGSYKIDFKVILN